MCVVLIVPETRRPSIETLRLCEHANPHGGGIAWRNNGTVEFLKTNDVGEIDSLARKIKGELVIHFRIASVGGVCDELRHPFPITRKASLEDRGRTGAVLFQNGTWGGYREALEFAAAEGHSVPAGEHMSDTRAAAFLVSIYGHKFLKKCTPSRWVYYSAKENIRYGDWCKHDGIYYSNLHWMPRTPRYEQPKQPLGSHRGQSSELFDLKPVGSYWEHLQRNTPKPKKLIPCPACDIEFDADCQRCKGKGEVYQ